MEEAVVEIRDNYGTKKSIEKSKEEIPLSTYIGYKLSGYMGEGELESMRNEINTLRDCLSKVVSFLFTKGLIDKKFIDNIGTTIFRRDTIIFKDVEKV